MAEFTLSIDRTDLGLSPLILSGEDDANVWGILPGWQMPTKEPIVSTATSPYTHDGVDTHWKFQRAIMSGDVSPEVTSTAALAAAIAELEAAIHRLTYETTVTRKGVLFGVWTCHMGTLAPSPLDYVDLANDRQPFSLVIPCYPIPGGA